MLSRARAGGMVMAEIQESFTILFTTARMHAMLKRAAVVLVVAVCLSSCTMWNKTASGWSGATGGEKIEQYFWDDVKNKDFRSVELRVSSTLVASGPSGRMDRAAFLQQIRSANASSVTLTDCASHLNGGDLMITCTLQRDGRSAGRFTTLSVWQQYSKGWLLVAHSEVPVLQ